MTTRRRRSRYVPKKTRRELVIASRGRCCLCRELIVPGEQRYKKVSQLLEGHHIVYFSAGGGNTENNLILVCPTCHAQLHASPTVLTTEKLRRKKAHWKEMIDVVPSLLTMPPRGDITPVGEPFENNQMLPLRFSIESLGLAYEVRVPSTTIVGELLDFALTSIIAPLGRYDDNPDWIDPERAYLALRSQPRRVLPNSTYVTEVTLRPADAFIAIIHRPTVAAPSHRHLSLRATPESPADGQGYVATASVGAICRQCEIQIEVNGTDGYKARSQGIPGHDGTHSIHVPGARGGVVDHITATALGERVAIELVFQIRDRRSPRQSSIAVPHVLTQHDVAATTPLTPNERGKLQELRRLIEKGLFLTGSEKMMLKEFESREGVNGS